MSLTPANHYQLEGANSTIVYGPDIAGRPHIVLNDRVFDEVSVEPTSAGELATAVIDLAPDVYTKRITVLIPPVHVSAGPQPVETIAVFSTHRTSAQGTQPLVGQLIEYEIEIVKGTADHILT
ncbi:hypothetical protein [Hoeflea poritis]|uniref:Uncharacterized protein n=1 Tax=Hoeflea poritis TaxID=2993659 RepID=A0ABT4VMT1_9HYPH|nr:hypothetical protein [Hoeflea poritis]MDA4845997.1 hypothetical protein [Hoeflea poritis]